MAPLSRRRHSRICDVVTMNFREDSADSNDDVILNRHGRELSSQHVSSSCCGPVCGRYPQMRQAFTSQNFSAFTRSRAPSRISLSVAVCVVLASGAAFGMAAQAALHHFALDFGSIRDELIVGRTANARAAVAWWA